MKSRTAAILVAGAMSAVAAGASADTGSFGNWAVVCDNVRTCTAVGFGELGEMGSSGFLEIRRSGEADAAPTARLLTAGEGAATLTLQVDGASPPALSALPATPGAEDQEPAMRVTELTSEQTAALVGRIADGRSLTALEQGQPAVSVSLSGSSAALRFMDDRQKRAGTRTALVARGDKPASAVPAAPAAPVLTPAPRIAQGGLPNAPSAALRAKLSGCDEDIAEIGLEPVVARLAKGKLFWGVACSRGAYNVIYSLFVTDEAGGNPQVVQLPYPGGEPASEVMNIGFDPDTQTLSNFDKGRGLGDCGALNEWVWTGSRFAMKAQTIMPECQGVLPEFWPVSYRSR